MKQPAQDTEFQSRMRQLDQLVGELSSIENADARERVAQIVQGLMDFHGAAVGKVIARIGEAGEAGRTILDDLAADELTASLLLLYGLHPRDLSTRVRSALDKVRPYLASHGGCVELLQVSEDGIVRLAMQGSCHGCPSSAVTLKSTIEQAIYDAAPDVAGIEVEGAGDAAPPAHPQGFVSVERLIGGVKKRQTA